MAPVMFVDAARRNRSTASMGRLLALFVAVAFVLTMLTGNSFALHVGMTAGSPPATASADPVSDVVAGMPGVADLSDEGSGDAAALMPVSSDLQHLIHLIGACLAVLAVAAMLARLLFLNRALTGGLPAVTALPRPLMRAGTGEWLPPPPSPPTSSPVIRT